jgi:hypothetical protein
MSHNLFDTFGYSGAYYNELSRLDTSVLIKILEDYRQCEDYMKYMDKQRRKNQEYALQHTSSRAVKRSLVRYLSKIGCHRREEWESATRQLRIQILRYQQDPNYMFDPMAWEMK